MKKQNKKLRLRLVSGLVTLLLVISIIMCIFVFTQIVSKGYVSIGGCSFFRVATGSMEPTIPVGALIMTKEEDISNVVVDDIVSFYSKEQYMQGRIITHRVIGRDVMDNGQVRLTTRGDANSSADVHFVDADNYIGRVIWTSAENNPIAALVKFLSSGMGFFSCVALPTILVAIIIFKNSITNMTKEIKRMKEKLDGEANTSDIEDISEEDENKTNTNGDDSAREYEEMCERIRAELIEELKQGNDREQIKKQ